MADQDEFWSDSQEEIQSLEEMLQEFMQWTDKSIRNLSNTIQNPGASIWNLEFQVGHIVSMLSKDMHDCFNQ